MEVECLISPNWPRIPLCVICELRVSRIRSEADKIGLSSLWVVKDKEELGVELEEVDSRETGSNDILQI